VGYLPISYILLINFSGNALFCQMLIFAKLTIQILTRLLSEQGLDSDLGPSSSSVSTATPPNGRNGRLLTPTSDDGEYVEYSFDSLSDMPYTVEDEDRVSHTSNSLPFVVIVVLLCCTFLCSTL